MKSLIIVVLFSFISSLSFAQKVEIYDTKADAMADISEAVEKASLNGKHVFLQIGGNWCPWCIKFHIFLNADEEINSYVKDNFEVVEVNYDQYNKQEELMEKLAFPQRFGFPVFVVLDGRGNLIHTQNSAFLEKDKSYDRKRVLSFFKNWSAVAISPSTYIK